MTASTGYESHRVGNMNSRKKVYNVTVLYNDIIITTNNLYNFESLPAIGEEVLVKTEYKHYRKTDVLYKKYYTDEIYKITK